MQINYYPWNTDLLKAWIATEQAMHADLEDFSKAIGIKPDVLLKWKRVQFVDITLEQINALARYRAWTFAETILWLGIKDFHLAELKKRRPFSRRIPESSFTSQSAFEPLYDLIDAKALTSLK
ncbi:MAG TPA: hypothetical protein VIQ31_40330 [Phormidium sp.]